MAEPIPVSLTRGRTWRSPKSFGIQVEMIFGLSKSGWRIVHTGVSTRQRLDARSRAQDDNRWETDEKKIRERGTVLAALRRGNKGLSMELTMSSLLTHLDHPAEVTCNCFVRGRDSPNKAAGGGTADIVYRPAGSREFQVVCEVSANKSMSDGDYREQLERALVHADSEHKAAGVPVTYVFLVNLREFGSDERIQKVYRDFLKENKDDLCLLGPIRFVPMEAAEFATVLKRLYYEEILSFRSDLFAAALDDLHDATWNEKVHEEQDWMTKRMYTTIFQESQVATSMFPAPRPPILVGDGQTKSV